MLGNFDILPTVPVSEDFFLQCWDDDMIALLLEAYDEGRVIQVLDVPVYIATVSLSLNENDPVEFLCRYLRSEDSIRRPCSLH